MSTRRTTRSSAALSAELPAPPQGATTRRRTRQATRKLEAVPEQLARLVKEDAPSASSTRSTRSKSRQMEMGIFARRGTKRVARDRSLATTIATNPQNDSNIDSQSQYDQSQSQPLDTANEHHEGAASTESRAITSVQESESEIRITAEESPEQKKVRARVMEFLLDKLFHASEDLCAHLKDPLPDDMAWQIEFDAFKGAFETYRQNYTDSEVPFILPSTVTETLEATGQIDVGSRRWLRTTKTLMAANLSRLLEDLYLLPQDTRVDTLRSIDGNFPGLFLPPADDNHDGWMAHTDVFDLALQIRTQTFLETMATTTQPDLRPRDIVAQIFCENYDPSSQDPNDILELGPFRPIFGLSFDREELDKYTYRIDEICAALPEGNESVDISTLDISGFQRQHPFEEFKQALVSWAHDCFDEIRLDLTKSDVAHHRYEIIESPLFVDGSQSQDGRVDSQAESEIMSQASIVRADPSESRLNLFKSKNALEQLKKLDLRDRRGVPPPSNQLAQSRHRRTSEVDWDEGRESIILRSLPEAARISGTLEQDGHSQSSVGNETASDANDVGAGGQAFAVPASKFIDRKRSQADAIEEEEEEDADTDTDADADADADADDPFEIDQRMPTSKRRRFEDDPPNKRLRFEAQSQRYPEPTRPSQRTLVATQSPSRAQVRPPASPPASPSEATGANDNLDLSALKKRAHLATVTANAGRPQQQRTPWTDADTRFLIQCVDVYHCKWSQIEDAYARGQIRFDHPRDQQAMRDKARNLKVDLLKTDAVLPPSFDLVTLSKKERAKVIYCGKNPDRREADVDERGCPINTLYQEDDAAES